MAERRRLPVIQSAPPKKEAPTEEEEHDENAIETRPPWHWVGFGTIAIFAAWLPLAYVAQAAVARVLAQRFGAEATAETIATAMASMPAGERARLTSLLALPNAVAVAVACFAGGYLVGRFGSGTTSREAGTAGAMVALVALVLALGGGVASGVTALVTAVVTLVLTVGFSTWGGRVGLRAREKQAQK